MNFKEKYSKRDDYNKKNKKEKSINKAKRIDRNDNDARIEKIKKNITKKASLSLIIDKDEETFLVASLIALDHMDKILANEHSNDDISSVVKSYLQEILNSKDPIDQNDNDEDDNDDNDNSDDDDNNNNDDDESSNKSDEIYDEDEDSGTSTNITMTNVECNDVIEVNIFSKMVNILAKDEDNDNITIENTNKNLSELKLSEKEEEINESLILKTVLDEIKLIPVHETEKIIKKYIRNDRYQSKIEMRRKAEERMLKYNIAASSNEKKSEITENRSDTSIGLPMQYQIPADLPPKVRVHLSCDSGKPNANKEKMIVFDRIEGISGLLALARDKFNVGKKYEFLVLKSKELLTPNDIATTKADLYVTLTSKIDINAEKIDNQIATPTKHNITHTSDLSSKNKGVVSKSPTSIVTEPLPSSDIYELVSPRKFDLSISEKMLKELEEFNSNPKYRQIIDSKKSLPIYNTKDALLNTINNNKITVVSGETGSGKTTQLPAYLLEDLIMNKKGSEGYIICTQPRRIAAISVAERVAFEMGETIGETIGYQVRLNSRISSKSRIIYCTTGVLLRKLQVPNFLDLCSHIVVDEVHERQVETDFLMALLHKKAVDHPHLRLIMMSATMQETIFSNYFKCPIVYVSGRTFPVEQYYLEDILKLVAAGQGEVAQSRGYQPPKREFSSKTWVNEMKKMLTDTNQDSKKGVNQNRTGFKLPKFDADGVAEVIIRIIQKFSKKNDRANAMKSSDNRGDCILVFLSGIQAIEKVSTSLRKRNLESINASVMTLHGSLPPEQQKKVFRQTKPNEWKVILSTNIAETSVTIDDVTHVLDVGTHKEMKYNPTGNISSLQEVVISKAGARQRAGRAGRVRAGFCWRLYTKQFHDVGMDEYPVPEIKRVPLEEVVLQILLLKLGMPEEFLGLCLEPPSFSHIKAAVKALLDINAILPQPQLPLTPLGIHLARMPVDCRIGKMLIISCLLGCLEPCLTIAAALGGKSPFVSPNNARNEAKIAHNRFVGKDTCSDHLAIVNAYDTWLNVRNSQGKTEAHTFCIKNFLSMTVLEEILLLRKDFKSYLKEAGFVDDNGVKRLYDELYEVDNDNDNDNVLPITSNISLHVQHQMTRCCLFAGLYPQICRLTQYTDKQHPKGKGRQDLLPIHILQLDGTEVFLHPSSLNINKLNNAMETKNGKLREAYLVYNKLVASGVANMNASSSSNEKSNNSLANTGRPYLYDCTSIPLPALLLFGGDVSINGDRDMMIIKDPNSKLETSVIKIKTSELHAVLFKRLQNEIESILKLKIEDTTTDISMRQSLLISVLEKLLARYAE